MIAPETRQAISDLYADYAHYIDTDRLEEWLEFFTPDCVYKIVPRENDAAGLPLSVMLCENRNMLRDRVVSLREANIYNLHIDRHFVSGLRIGKPEGGVYPVQANFAVYQTTPEGVSMLFSVGVYNDRVTFVNGAPRFKEKTVVIDTAAIINLLATPL